MSDSSGSPIDEQKRKWIDEKYREERDKRIQHSGPDHFVAVEGEFARFATDPYTEFQARPARNESVDTVVVGAGISGLSAGVELRKAGVDDFRVIDEAGDFGGTWYWNRYPGLRCDCESYIYLPYLEETGYVPSEKYVRGTEILEYLRSLARRFDLYENALFQTKITEIRWSGSDSRWVVRTDRGDEIRSRFVVLNSGPLHRPKLPKISGIEEFEGVQFHSSRWDYGATGGDTTGGLTKLPDKRVAVIGTSSSGVGIIPPVARDAQHLYVVQRTPALVDERNNAPTDKDWFAGQGTGWQERRKRNFDAILAGIAQEEDLVGDQWTEIWGGVAEAMATGSLEATAARLADADIEQMERIRARIDREVHDTRVVEALKPYYGRFCKRPQFSDEYLPTFNRPNVTLIDTQGRGLDRITRNGIVFDGTEYPVDLIVHATGFEFGVAPQRAGGFEVYGPDGTTLTEHRAQGLRTLHGVMFHGFPNLFVIGGLHQAAVSINIPLVFCEQARHVASVARTLLDREVVVADATSEAVDSWCCLVAERSTFSDEAARNCTPGWANNSGAYEPGTENVFADAFGGGPLEYLTLLENWRSDALATDLALDFDAKTITRKEPR